MPRDVLTAVAAGLASAAAALAFLSGSFLAIGLVYMAPLPMLMAGLALGPRVAAIAALAGIMVMGMFGGPAMAGVFAVVHGLPTWAIVKLALSARVGAAGAGAADTATNGGSAAGAWMAPGAIVSVMALFAAGLLIVAAMAVGDAGLSGFVADHLGRVFETMAPGLEAADRGRITQTMTPLFPGTVAASWVVMVAVNTVIAQGVLARIGRNRRPSPGYLGLELPGWLSWPLVGAAVMALVGPGEWEYLGRNLTMVLALPYFFLGLAVFHTLARRVAATKMLLVTFYLVIVISIWAALVVAGIGIVEQWYGLRARIQLGLAGGNGRSDEDD